MIKKVIIIMGLPGSGKTTYAKSILNDDRFLIDDPNRDPTQFDKAVDSGKSEVIICDPLLIVNDTERAINVLNKKFGTGIDIEWLYFENDQQAAWLNHLKRNETEPRGLTEKFHKHLSKQYVIPEGANTIPVYKPTKD